MIYIKLCISAESPVKLRRAPPRIINEVRGISGDVD
jgi:hypothetical protein